MSPHRPEVMVFKSQDQKRELRLPLDGPAEYFKEGKKQKWPADGGYEKSPSEVLFFPKLDRLVFLGGLGDSSSMLGIIQIVSEEGKVLKDLNAKDLIKDLELEAGNYGMFGNFPWIAGIKLDGPHSFILDVCEKFWIKVNVKARSQEKIKRQGDLKNSSNSRSFQQEGKPKPKSD